MREADLDKHLSNKQQDEGETAKPDQVIKQAPADKPGKTDKGGKDKKPALEPGEVVSKNDFQVNQALNLLKGLQIFQAR